MITDKVFLEIFNNRIQAAVEEMANVVLRTGLPLLSRKRVISAPTC